MLEFQLELQGFTDQLSIICNYFHNYFIRFSNFLRKNLLYVSKQNISGLWTKQTFKDVIEGFGKH